MVKGIVVYKNDRYYDKSFTVVELCDGVHDSNKPELCTCVRHGGNLSSKEAYDLAKELANKNNVEITSIG